jgi:hypothetical protein
MKYWIGLLCIVLLFLLLLPFSSFVEKFSAADRRTFIATERSFSPANNLYINPGLTTDGINQALNTTDGTSIDYTNRFQVDPLIQFRSKDEMTCRLARHPRQLSRAPTAKTGCGWWFVADGLSVGTTGTSAGPADHSIPRMHPTGTWIWNLDDAARMEDIKLCKRITLCEALTADCGWCESQGHGVPIYTDGTVKYPTDDVGSCSLTPYRSGTCPSSVAPPSEPIVDTNGNVVGERTPPAAVSLCAPRNGILTRECLLALATSCGCIPAGTLYQMIARGSPPTESDRIAIDILAKANIITLTPDLYGNGGVSVRSALDAYTALTNAMVSGRSHQIQQAARYLAIGGDEVDLCDVGATTLGPFSPECLSRAFREAGCQASGAKFPTDTSAVSGLPWGSVKQSYRTLASSMYSTDAFAQADAIKDCLGPSLDIFTKV